MTEHAFKKQLLNLQQLDLRPVKVVMCPEDFRDLKPLMEPAKKGKTGWGYLYGLEVGLSTRQKRNLFRFYSAAHEELSPQWN
jgi:hypothetical protein